MKMLTGYSNAGFFEELVRDHAAGVSDKNDTIASLNRTNDLRLAPSHTRISGQVAPKFWCDTRGAVLIEAAIVLPVMLLLIVGGFDINLAAIAETKLTFNTNFAAAVEASTPGTGVAWGSSQMPTAMFAVTSPGCVSGSLPYAAMILPTSWFHLTATACAPTQTQTQTQKT
jgi:hypothetical protein